MRIVGKFIDLTGQKFGKLVVVERYSNKGKEIRWVCKCECGNQSVVMGRNLRNGSTKSCGCYNSEQPRTHGMSRTRFYTLWASMLRRCSVDKGKVYEMYKGKGVDVCPEWREFERFFEDMHDSYRKHTSEFGERNTTLDRIDGDKGYSLENCRWATYEKQSRNRSFANEYPGVVFRKRSGKWRANIGIDGKQIHLGTFETFNEALATRKEAENKYWRNV